MTAVVFIGFVALLIAAAMIFPWPEARADRAAMFSAAKHLELAASRDGSEIRGTRRGFPVAVEIRNFDPECPAEETVVSVISPSDLVSTGPLLPALRPRGSLEVETAAIWVGAREIRLITQCALAETARIIECVERLLDAAELLVREAGEIRRRCLDEALHAKDESTRAAALQKLLDAFPHARETEEAIEGCLLDREPRVVLIAALAAKRSPTAALERLVRDKSAPEEVRAEALKRLTDRPRLGARLLALLEECLADSSDWVRQIAIFHLGRERHAPVLPRLIDMVPTAPDVLAPTIAKALGRLGDARAEAPLIALLGRGGTALKLAAAEALSKVGSTAAIDPLLRCKARTNESVEENVRFVLDAAVSLIKERAGEVERGALSVAAAPAQAGTLAYAQDGQLSAPGTTEPQ